MFVLKNNDFYSLHSNKEYEIGEVVHVLNGEILDYPTRTSIQIGKDIHIEDEDFKYTNHSCSPNIKITDGKIIAIKKINIGDEIAFNYNDSEEEVRFPFICNCCGMLIKGRKHSQTEVKA